MLSSPNVYKYNRVVLREEEARVIDSNEKMAEKIAALSLSLQQSLSEENGEDFPEEFSDGLEAAQVSALLADDGGAVIKAEPVYDGPSPDELLAEAQAEIDAMMEQARSEAEALRSQAYEEGLAAGQKDGYAKGYQETESLKARLLAEAQEKEEQLIRIYQEKIHEIEPEMVDMLTDIYEHVFQVQLSDQKDVIQYLLENALRKVESSAEYLVHVSREDMAYVSANKEALMEAGGIANAHFDIIEDLTLKENQCLLETENGIFDCSLGVELQELKRQLLLLSYDGIDGRNEN